MSKPKQKKPSSLSGLITLTAEQIAAIRSDSGIAFGSNTPEIRTPFEYRDISKDAHNQTRVPIRYSSLVSANHSVGTSDYTIGTVTADALFVDWTMSFSAYADQTSNQTYVRARLEIIRNGSTIWLTHGISQTYRVMAYDGGGIQSSYALEYNGNGYNGVMVLLAGDVINLHVQYASANGAAAATQLTAFACVNTQPFR